MQRLVDAQVMSIEAVLQAAKDRQAPMSCRAEGATRSLARLHCIGFLPGESMDLANFGWRDHLPSLGTIIQMAILVEDDVCFLKAPVLGSIHGDGNPMLRLGWPAFSAAPQPKARLAVAANGLPSLPALLWRPGEWLEAQVLNLTGRFADLGLGAAIPLELHQQVEAQTLLPDGCRLAITGEVQRFAWVKGDPQPMRFRVTLERMVISDQEALCRFILGRNLAAPGKVYANFRLKHPAPPTAGPSGLDPLWGSSFQRPGTSSAHAVQQ